MSEILYEVKKKIAYITLNAPEVLNPLTAEIKAGLVAVLSECKTDPHVRAVIITGSGKAFSAGGDIRAMAVKSGADEKRDRFVNGLNDLPKLVAGLEKPIIAAVNGFAIGAGFTFALSCDLIVAAETAKFGISFGKMGLCPDAGGTYLIPKAVGLHKAKELALTGRIFSATEAERMGFVNRVVPAGKLMEEADKLAGEIICWPRYAVGLTKNLFNQGMNGDLIDALEREAFAQGLCMVLPDHQEAVQAFLEKRDPIFKQYMEEIS